MALGRMGPFLGRAPWFVKFIPLQVFLPSKNFLRAFLHLLVIFTRKHTSVFGQLFVFGLPGYRSAFTTDLVIGWT